MAMTFTARALTEAQEEPTLRIGNLLYRGRILSAPEWLVFWERHADLGDAFRALLETPAAATERAVVRLERTATALRIDYLRAVFPRRRFKFWAPDPVKALARGHPRDLKEAFDAFFSLQARAMQHPGAPPETRSTPATPVTDGTPSPPSIIVGPATGSA